MSNRVGRWWMVGLRVRADHEMLQSVLSAELHTAHTLRPILSLRRPMR